MWQWTSRSEDQSYIPVRSAAATLHRFGGRHWVLLSGGFGDNSTVQDTLHVCEFTANGSPLGWKSAGRDDLFRRHDHATAICGDRVLIYGGCLHRHFFEDLLEICALRDPSILVQTVRCSGDPPGPRSNHSMVPVGSALWLFGGCRLDTEPPELYNDVLVFDADVWIRLRLADPPPPRSGHSCVAFGGGLVVFGGWDGRGLLHDVCLCNGAAWRRPRPAGKCPAPRACHSATIIAGDRMVVHGGLASFDQHSPSCCVLEEALHILDLTLLQWSAVQFSGAPPSPRAFHCAVALPGQTSSLLVLGGGTRTDDDGTNFADAHELRLVGWTPEDHNRFPISARRQVLTWLLIGQRLQVLPFTLWLYVACFWVGSEGCPDADAEAGVSEGFVDILEEDSDADAEDTDSDGFVDIFQED